MVCGRHRPLGDDGNHGASLWNSAKPRTRLRKGYAGSSRHLDMAAGSSPRRAAGHSGVDEWKGAFAASQAAPGTVACSQGGAKRPAEPLLSGRLGHAGSVVNRRPRPTFPNGGQSGFAQRATPDMPARQQDIRIVGRERPAGLPADPGLTPTLGPGRRDRGDGGPSPSIESRTCGGQHAPPSPEGRDRPGRRGQTQRSFSPASQSQLGHGGCFCFLTDPQNPLSLLS